MDRPLWSVSDVAEALMCEFGSRVEMSTITRTVMQMSCDGTVPLPELAASAREELIRLVAADGGCATADNTMRTQPQRS
jgi:hypothetical protein